MTGVYPAHVCLVGYMVVQIRVLCAEDLKALRGPGLGFGELKDVRGLSSLRPSIYEAQMAVSTPGSCWAKAYIFVFPCEFGGWVQLD